MKAFEDWLEIGKLKSNMMYEDDACHTWRAALEWTLKMAKELDKQDVPIDTGDVIREELDGE